jgi:hypothetical protein
VIAEQQQVVRRRRAVAGGEAVPDGALGRQPGRPLRGMPEVADGEQREARALGRRRRLPARQPGRSGEASGDPEQRRGGEA